MKKTLYVIACACISLLALPAAAQVPAYVPTDGLVGWWPFNGNANDESGNGNDGMVNGATLTEDRNSATNSAYSFDGINDGIDLGVAMSGILHNHDFTISFWTLNSDDGVYFSDRSGPNQGYGGFIIGSYPNGDIVYGMGGGGAAGSEQFIAALNNSNTLLWRNISISYHYNDNDSNVVAFYTNGIFDTLSNTLNNPWAPTTAFWIGREDFISNSGYALNGLIDDIAIYNRALTEQEIQNLYSGTTPPPCAALPSNLQQGLVGYWPFCGNANDESGNGNDGTVNGATLTEDRFGNAGSAYSFDEDFIIIPSSEDFNSNNISISLWSKTSDLQRQCAIIRLTYDNASNEHVGILFNDLNPFGVEAAAKYNNPNCTAGLGWEKNEVVENILDSSYHHIVGIIQDSIISFYIDGQIRNQLYISFSQSESCWGGDFQIGRNWSGFVDYFHGSLDDIGIWNRALTPEEVQELYTLDACTFTVYDTSYVTVYDTLTTYETVYDTLYTYETIYDTVTTYITVTDTLLIDITFTGFEGQPSWLNTVTVFPNPASDHITIDYGNFALMAGYNTIITDAAGATVYSSAVNSQQAYIDINAWGAAGVYYMTIYDASGAPVAVRHIVLE